jgi:hypothetical protein
MMFSAERIQTPRSLSTGDFPAAEREQRLPDAVQTSALLRRVYRPISATFAWVELTISSILAMVLPGAGNSMNSILLTSTSTEETT